MSSYLLDTHTLLWATSQAEMLTEETRGLLVNPDHRFFVSLGSVWELSIKVSIGKLSLPEPFFRALPSLGYEWLPMTEEHFACYRTLPLHHRDPFDRLLVAQSIIEEIPLISCDPEIRKYDALIVW